jgi:ATP-grasp domain, R2K clade family 2
MITRVFIQEKGKGKLEPENQDLLDEFSARGYSVNLFTEKLLVRRRLPLDRSSLVAGDIPVVIGALKQLGIKIPVPDDYPECLRAFLRRRVWETRLDKVRERVYRGDFHPFFIKPKSQLKRFTGRVIESCYDLSPVSNVSQQTPVYCSEVVQWRTEYRIFVINGAVRGVRHYRGDPMVTLDEAETLYAISALESSGKAATAYGIDFGVLESGETALVELNDGFSLGSYGLERSVYADLILTRWTELMSGGSSTEAT